uniref:Uncharacterized protein n=1 Tax=Mus spicilegus TaxID=10103 RepID=A0A8C6N2I7_MUSSI
MELRHLLPVPSSAKHLWKPLPRTPKFRFMLQSGECFDGCRATGKSALHTASEMRQSSPALLREKRSPVQHWSSGCRGITSFNQHPASAPCEEANPLSNGKPKFMQTIFSNICTSPTSWICVLLQFWGLFKTLLTKSAKSVDNATHKLAF